MIRLLLLFAFSTSAIADPQKGIVSGDKAAHSFLNTLGQEKSTAENHPFYKGIPHESNLTDADITQKSRSQAQLNSTAQFIRGSSESRPQFVIDPQKDPLFTSSRNSLEKPLEVIGGKGTHTVKMGQKNQDEELSCEESGDVATETCTHELKVRVTRTQEQKEWRGAVRIRGCPVFGMSNHPKECGNLTKSLIDWANTPIYTPPIPSSTDITGSFRECLGQVSRAQNRLTCSCRMPEAQLPLHFKPEFIKSAFVERDASNRPKVGGYFVFYTTPEYPYKFDYTAHIKVLYEEEKIDVQKEWVSSCDLLEKKVDQGLCSYGKKVCTKGPETRVINGVSIKEDCWQYTYTYSCEYPSKNDCGPLRARGCVQIKSACKDKSGKTCVNYLQTYQCKGNLNSAYTEVIKGGKTPFCLDGNCRDQSWESNDEMMSSIAQLSLLKEMQGQFSNGLLFKGEDKRCSKFILSFKDCCGSGKGWGKDLGLASCSSGEKALSQKRKKGLCHFVGTYCAKKVLGKCIKKKSSYCCFTNKLLKAFHVQGRPQIGLAWGSPKEPLCRGFTIEEIQRIDFSKLDLREVFEDLMQNFKADKLNVKDMGKTINDRMKTIQKSIGPNQTQNVRQRNGA